MRLCLYFSIALVFSGCASILFAQSPSPTPADGQQAVADRLNQLEAETQALRAEVARMREQPVRLPSVAEPTEGAVAATPVGSSSLTGDAAPLTREDVQSEIKKYAWRKGDFSIVPYGILWGNTAFETERTTPGCYTLYVQSASTGSESDYLVDGRNSRLGVDVLGPTVPVLDGLQTGGKVEFDFQNSPLNATAGENKATVLLRHAYVEARNDEYRLLIGQTWDVISPIWPSMLMASIGWDAGNIGYRRAQLRGERFLTMSDTLLTTVQLSLNSQAFSDSCSTKTPVGTLIGEPSNWPILEGRVAWTIGERGKGCNPIVVGVSGHIGNQEFDYTGFQTLSDQYRRTWSGNVDIRVPITERFGVQGECYVGENLGTFLGGIGQGVDPIGLNTIRDAGGWFDVWYDWTSRLHSHVGYCVDDPDDNDIHNTAGGRLYNQCYFGNLTFDVTKSFLIGAEVSSWRTIYLAQLPGDSVRCEFVAKYGF